MCLSRFIVWLYFSSMKRLSGAFGYVYGTPPLRFAYPLRSTFDALPKTCTCTRSDLGFSSLNSCQTWDARFRSLDWRLKMWKRIALGQKASIHGSNWLVKSGTGKSYISQWMWDLKSERWISSLSMGPACWVPPPYFAPRPKTGSVRLTTATL